MLFWYELKQAGLIGGVTDAALNTSNEKNSFGEVLPAAELGGGFWAAYSDGKYGAYEGNNSSGLYTGRPEGAGKFTLNGNVLVMVKYPTGSRRPVTGKLVFSSIDENGDGVLEPPAWHTGATFVLNAEEDSHVLSSKEAAEIDRKLDDGFPNTGSVQAYGNFAGRTDCYNTTSLGYIYDETVEKEGCGLYIKIRE